MIVKQLTLTGALGLALMLASAPTAKQASAQNRFTPVIAKIDKTKKGRRTTRSLAAEASKLASIAGRRFIRLDLRVQLDGKNRYAVLTSAEGADRRFPVQCGARNFGRQTMGSDIEYYFQRREAGKLYRVSIYPGARASYPFNDVSCVSGSAGNKADLRLQGYFLVLVNSTPKSVDLQLRPIKPKDSEIQ